MSGIEEIAGLIGILGEAAGAMGAAAAPAAAAAGTGAAAAGTAAATGAEALTATSMLAPFTELPAGITAAGGITPGTGMLTNPGAAAAGAPKGSGKALSGLMGGGDKGMGGLPMDRLKMAAQRKGPNAPAGMTPLPQGRGGSGQPSALTWLQMLSQRPKPQLRFPGSS